MCIKVQGNEQDAKKVSNLCIKPKLKNKSKQNSMN